MKDIIFIHGMFQNPKSWSKWADFFAMRGYTCHTPAWPMHDGEPADLRSNPPVGLGELALNDVVAKIDALAASLDKPILIGHSVGGLIVQLLVNRGRASAGIAINSVAPNGMLDFDWSFIKNSAIIANPLKGDEPIYMDAETFHGVFANTLSEADAERAFNEYATHDSRNVLRDCMGQDGKVDLDKPHAPLLLIAGEKDEIIPPTLTEKNFKAYTDTNSITYFKSFANRSHFICGEPGWEDVANYAATWLQNLHLPVSETDARLAS